MQYTFVSALIVFAIGANAAPAIERRLDSIPLSIYPGLGCNSGPTPLTTAFVPTDGKCFSISPIVSGNTDSGIISQSQLRQLPAGCTLVAYSDPDCTSQNSILYDVTGRCGTFGPGSLIRSAKAIGACA